MPGLDGKVVFLTGASGAIGRATARLFAEHGARLFLTDLRPDEIDHREAAIPPDRATFRALDVRDSGEVRRAMAECAERFGPIHVLVANAGICPRRAFVDISDDEWSNTFAVNVDGVFYCCREVLRHMPPGGAIVALASISGHRGTRDHVHYSASKGAVLSLMRGLAWELAPDIRVNCVSPGPVQSPMITDLMRHRGDEILRQTHLGRIARPDEIARSVLFLSSEWASHITGVALHVNGGSYIAG